MNIFKAFEEVARSRKVFKANLNEYDKNDYLLMYKKEFFEGYSNVIVYEWVNGKIEVAFLCSIVYAIDWKEIKQRVTFDEVLNSDKKYMKL